jgi:hypothetical protein
VRAFTLAETGTMRLLKAFTAAAVAASMAGTPVLAQSAAPLSVASAVSRSGAATEDANALRSHVVVSAVVVLVLVLGALLIPEITKPNSP